jgi:transcriptional regulator with XRE-family HTH domain
MLTCISMTHFFDMDVAFFLQQVGERVVRAREERGISRAQLAARAGLPLPLVAALESGESGVDVDALHRVADALDLPTPALLPDRADLRHGTAPSDDAGGSRTAQDPAAVRPAGS